jgi:protein involved in polysaccharide export with SLBB domain
MPKLLWCALASLATLTFGSGQTVKRAASATPDTEPNATLRAGDTFEVSLGGVPPESADAQSFNKPHTVGADGTVNLPYVGIIRAAGLTQSQIEKVIERRLIEEKIFRWPTITLNVPERARLITVGGKVRVPQRTYWSADTALISALNAARAGEVLAAQVKRARLDVNRVCVAMTNYQRDFGVLPMGTSDQILDDLMNGDGRKKLIFFAVRANQLKGGEWLDPWGRPYQIGSGPGGPWAYSFGPNEIDEGGTFGSDDIVSWQQ